MNSQQGSPNTQPTSEVSAAALSVGASIPPAAEFTNIMKTTSTRCHAIQRKPNISGLEARFSMLFPPMFQGVFRGPPAGTTGTL